MKRVLSVLLSLVFLAVCFVCFGVSAEGNAVRIVFTDGVPEWNGGDVAWNGSVLSIRGAGEYILSGSCPQGRVSLEAGKKDRVTLVLSGLEIASDTGRTFEITRADEVTLVLSDGTENKISALAEGGNGAAAVYSKGDLVISGPGKLTVVSAGKHGIQSTDGITVQSGIIDITSAGSGLRAHDSVCVNGGDLRITASGDGLRATGDEERADRGWIGITGGTVTVRAANDGLQAESTLTVSGGTLDVVTGGGSGEAEDSGDDEISRKGMKSKGLLTVSGGTVSVSSLDDAVHSDGAVSVIGGQLILSSGDDAVHADLNLTVSGGNIRILRSHDGLNSKGSLSVKGGTVILEGVKHAVKYGEDGVLSMDGGVVLSVGEEGAENALDEFPAKGFIRGVGLAFRSGDIIRAEDASGAALVEYEAAQEGDSLELISPSVSAGDTVVIAVGDARNEIQASDR